MKSATNRIALIGTNCEKINSLSNDLNQAGYVTDKLIYNDECIECILKLPYVAVILETTYGEDAFTFCEKFRPFLPDVPIIFLTYADPIDLIEKTFAKGFPDHIVNFQLANLSNWVLDNLNKLSATDPSGIEFYTGDKSSSLSFQIDNSKMKHEYIRRVINFVDNKLIREKIIGIVEEILDELITNALYNAPTDLNGTFLYQHFDRKIDLILPQTQAAVLSCLLNDDKIYLSIKDPFGSLTKEKLFSYLSECWENNHVHVKNKKGGAGIGLHKIFRLSHKFVVNIIPGQFSEFISCISQESEILKQETASLNVFIRK